MYLRLRNLFWLNNVWIQFKPNNHISWLKTYTFLINQNKKDSFIIRIILKIVDIINSWLISVAYFIIAEKIMGIIDRQKGPNIIGHLGLHQQKTAGLNKESIFSSNSTNSVLHFSFIDLYFKFNWMDCYSFLKSNSFIRYLLLNFAFISTSLLSVYGIIMAGWSSNSK